MSKTTPLARPRTRAARALILFLPAALAACDLPTSPPRFEPAFVVEAEPVEVPVTATPASSFTTRDLADLDPAIVRSARGGTVWIDVDNPAGAQGTVRIRLAGGGSAVEADLAIEAGTPARIDVDEAAMRAFLEDAVVIGVSGTLCPASGCATVRPPFPRITFRPRIEITFRIGGQG